MIGHQGSTYWRRSDKEKAEIFRKVELYLTYIDISALDRRCADAQSRIEELQLINETLKQSDIEKSNSLIMLTQQVAEMKKHEDLINRQLAALQSDQQALRKLYQKPEEFAKLLEKG